MSRRGDTGKQLEAIKGQMTNEEWEEVRSRTVKDVPELVLKIAEET